MSTTLFHENVGKVSMPRKKLSALLEGGDRRSVGCADNVAAFVSDRPDVFPELIAGLWSADSLVRMRAADATEKVTRKNAALLKSYKKKLLGLMEEAQQQELRWHLALMVSRLPLNEKERILAISSLTKYLEDHSSIVKTCALQ